MYKIYADDILIYDDTSSDPYLKVASPDLSLELGMAGSLKMTIPPGNAGYSAITRMVTTIYVTKDGITDPIWEGRVLQEDMDFWNNRVFVCEGALAYLNDTTQEQITISYDDPQACLRLALKDLIDVHNEHAPASRKIYVDNNHSLVTVECSEALGFTTDYENTLEAINKYLIQQFGGFLRVRTIGGVRYLDYLKEIDPAAPEANENTQTIEFGKNLMDFTKSFDATEFATVLVPLGAKRDKPEGYDGPDLYWTLESYSRPDDPYNGTRYVVSDSVGTYGWIERVVKFDEISDQLTLYLRAQEYLTNTQFNKMQITLSAFDLHYLNPSIEDVKLGDILRVKSAPHALDVSLPVQKLDIPLDRPQDTTFQLGGEIKIGYTSANNQIDEELFMRINEALDGDAILAAANAHVSSVFNQIFNGYISLETDETDGLHSEAFYISATKPVLPKNDGRYQAQSFWKWDMTGLGYTNDYGETWRAAITMDGTILGERIAAGSIHGSSITAGTLSIVTGQGTSGLDIKLESRGFPNGFLEFGTIGDQSSGHAGENLPSENHIYARTILKLYLSSGMKINVTGYDYEIFFYLNDQTPESGYAAYYGSRTGEFEIQADGYYRFVFHKANLSEITVQDLTAISNAVDILGGVSGVIRARDLELIGMATFHSFENSPTGGTTVIDGGWIKTETILADRLNIYGLTVYKKDSQTGEKTQDVSFSIDNLGNVFIDAQVSLSENSVVSFQSGGDSTLAHIKDAENIANGVYDGGTFINGQNIYSPFIYANIFTAIAEYNDTPTEVDPAGGFILKRKLQNGDLADAFHIYYWNNQGWEAHFAAEGQIVFDPPVRFLNDVTFGESQGNTVLFYGDNEFRGNIIMKGGQFIAYNGYSSGQSSNENSYGTASQRPSNPVVGQLYFQID